MTNQERQIVGPNFGKFTPVFDKYMHLIAPVGAAILKNLTPLPPNSLVLDVACGTGEPGLTLASENAQLKLFGIDLAENMAKLAQEKSTQKGLSNTEFAHMNAEQMTFADDTFDALISRFGLGMFGDTEKSIKEAGRVVKQNGQLSVAVWHDMSRNTFTTVFIRCIREALPDAELHAASNPTPGAKAPELFRKVGFTNLQQSEFTWNYRFEDLLTLKTTVEEMGSFMFANWLDKLSENAKSAVFTNVVETLQSFKIGASAYAIPHTCLLLSGRKEQDFS